METKYDNTEPRIASIRNMDISNGESIGISIFMGFCPIHCYNCFQPQLWDPNVGEIYTQQHEDKIIELMKPEYIKRLSILGGCPFTWRNYNVLLSLVKRVKQTYPNKKIWMYSGQYFEDLKETKWLNVIKYIDVLCDGPYEHDKRDITLHWVGSSNQRVIDIEDTLSDPSECIHEHITK